MEGTSKKARKEFILPRDGPYPRVELPYTYLIVWLVMHYPSLIKPREEPPEDAQIIFLRRFEDSKWSMNYATRIRETIRQHDNYSLFWCFPHISGIEYVEES